MNEQDKPERHFVAEKQPVMRELAEGEQPNLIAGADMSVMAFFNDVLRWIDRRRTAKKRAKASSGRSE